MRNIQGKKETNMRSKVWLANIVGRSVGWIGVALLLGTVSPTHAVDIDYITPGDTWRYICTAPAIVCPLLPPGNDFSLPTFDDSSWIVGNAPFSNVGSGDFAHNTYWGPGYDPVVRRTFTLGTPVDMTAELGLDNGYSLYVNGNLVSSANHEGFTYRWEYTVPINASNFHAGANVVALRLEDHGGLTAFDMHLFGDSSGLKVPVPEPSTWLLLGAGLAGLLAYRVRRQHMVVPGRTETL